MTMMTYTKLQPAVNRPTSTSMRCAGCSQEIAGSQQLPLLLQPAVSASLGRRHAVARLFLPKKQAVHLAALQRLMLRSTDGHVPQSLRLLIAVAVGSDSRVEEDGAGDSRGMEVVLGHLWTVG